MTILWLCNVPTKAIEGHLGISKSIGGGWLEGLSSGITKSSEAVLHYVFFSRQIRKVADGVVNGMYYHALPASKDSEVDSMVYQLTHLLQEVKPDIVHIFGSEYISSYAMMLASEQCGLIERTLLHVQGLISVYALHYGSGVPWKWRHLIMPRDLIRNTSMASEARDFASRGKYEVELIKRLRHVSGRTDWDRICIKQINPNVQYHFCNEILRDSFYEGLWTLDKCEKHSIFVSQGNYPIKGLHRLVEALPLIIKKFPETKVYVAGNDPTKGIGNWRTRLKRTAYGQYLTHVFRKTGVRDRIVFTGPLSESEMRNRYLKSNVFVAPSSIENSPNSLGEAMILGVPCVASYVGGVPSVFSDGIDGYLFQLEAPYMLAGRVCEIFGNETLAMQFSKSAREHAHHTHSKSINIGKQMSIYEAIIASADNYSHQYV